ncbi:ATP-binding protein [Halomonas saccharevitans]|uniref:ATP-binding protein n=1 Tax=Halomonas saccharevitans TaxID=416872 RepID=A0ABU3NAX7_9GAMM|nr:ATP-binding protein [Halomonas saccharevitans]MDT8878358.1 ATP-binding protein [Halomonas saccharevitans]
MSGLTAIILHHSIFHGKRSRIDCDGHTNVQGTNGAGKTSALKLIPVFYGQDPGAMVERAANKVSFADYYLPNHQSMVVFEYRRRDGACCCSILYRRSGGQLAYRFVEGAADETLFHSDLSERFAAGEAAHSIVGDALPGMGCAVSSQINSVMDYRSIIQNDVHASGKRRRKKAAKFSRHEDARRFSLGDGLGRMQHIEQLTAVVLDKSRLVSSLEDMVIDTMLRDRIDISDPPTHHKNADLWQNVESLEKFKQHEPRLRKALETHLALQDSREAITSTLSGLEQAIASKKEQLNTLEAQRRELDDNLEETRKRFDERREELNGIISQQRSEAQAAESWLLGQEKEQEAWDAKDIDTWQQRLDDLPSLRKALKGAEDALAYMSASATRIEETYHAQVNKVREEHGKAQADFTRRIDAANAELQDLNEAHNAAQAALEDEIRKEQDDLRTHDAQRADELRAAIQEIQEQRATAKDPTPEEAERLAEAVSSTQSAEALVASHLQQLNAANDAEEKEAQALERAERLFTQAKSARDLQSADVERLTRQVYPADGTLLAFLRNSGLDWHDGLGKLIDPRLLRRRDLHPRLSSTPDLTQAFGLELDLAGLERPDDARTIEELMALLEHASNRLEAAKKDVDRQEKAWKEAQQKQAKTAQSVTLSRSRHKNAEDQLSQCRATHRAIEAEVTGAGNQRYQALTGQLTDANHRLEKEKLEAEKRSLHLQRDHKARQLQLKADQGSAKDAVKERRDQIVVRREDHEASLTSRLIELEAVRDQALADEGIDIATRQAKKAEVARLTDEIEAAEAMRDEVFAYQQWQNLMVEEKPRKERSFHDAKRAQDKAELELSDAQQAYNSKRERLEAERQQVAANINGASQTCESWQRLCDNATGLLESIPVIEIPDRQALAPNSEALGDEQLATEMRRLIEFTTRQKQDVIKASRESSSLIAQHPETQIHDTWDRMSEARRLQSGLPEATEALYIVLMQDLQALVDEALPQVESALNETIHSIGGQLAYYHENLKNLDTMTSRVSRELEAQLNTQHEFSEISDVKVVVRSNIHEYDFWKNLSAFAQVWKAWGQQNFAGLPSTALLSSMSHVDKDLKAAKMATFDLKNLVSIEIQFREQGRLVPIRRDEDMKKASSEGLSNIAILILFSGLTRYLCRDPQVNITWPIDELGKLDPKNVAKIFRMMADYNITLLCAQPKLHSDVQRHFTQKVSLSKDGGVRIMRPREHDKGHNPLLGMSSSDASAPAGLAPQVDMENPL